MSPFNPKKPTTVIFIHSMSKYVVISKYFFFGVSSLDETHLDQRTRSQFHYLFFLNDSLFFFRLILEPFYRIMIHFSLYRGNYKKNASVCHVLLSFIIF